MLVRIKNILKGTVKVLSLGIQAACGGIILPLAAIIALPQRIYHSCTRNGVMAKESEVRIIMCGGVSEDAAQAIFGDINPSVKKISFFIQSRTNIPIQIIVFQNIMLLGFGFSVFLENTLLEYIDSNFFVDKEKAPHYFYFFSVLGGSMLSIRNLNLISINLDHIKYAVKRLIRIKTDHKLNDENRRIATEMMAVTLSSGLSSNDYPMIKELVDFCPKQRLKNISLEFEDMLKLKKIGLMRTVLKDILPLPLVRIIQGYSESQALFHMYGNALKHQSNTLVEIPADIQNSFDEDHGELDLRNRSVSKRGKKVSI